MKHMRPAHSQPLEELPNATLAIPSKPELLKSAPYPPDSPATHSEGHRSDGCKQNGSARRVRQVAHPLRERNEKEAAGKEERLEQPILHQTPDLLVHGISGISQWFGFERRLTGHGMKCAPGP